MGTQKNLAKTLGLTDNGVRDIENRDIGMDFGASLLRVGDKNAQAWLSLENYRVACLCRVEEVQCSQQTLPHVLG